MGEPISLSSADKLLREVYLPGRLEMYRMGRSPLWGPVREPATYSHRMTFLEPWWPARVWSTCRRKVSFAYTRTANAWNVLRHGLPEAGW